MTVWTLAIPSGMFLDSFHIRLFKFSWFLTANAIFLRHCSCSAAHLHWVFESEKILRHCPPCQDTNCWVFLKITGKMPFLLQWTITDILIQIHSYDAQTYYIHPVNKPASFAADIHWMLVNDWTYWAGSFKKGSHFQLKEEKLNRPF